MKQIIKTIYMFVCVMVGILSLSMAGVHFLGANSAKAAQCCAPPNKICANPTTGGKYCAEKCPCQNTVEQKVCDEESKECVPQECCADDGADCSDQCSSPANCGCISVVEQKVCDEESKECISQECCADDGADCEDACESAYNCGCEDVVEQMVCDGEECVQKECCADNGKDCSDQCIYGGCKICEEGTVSLPNGEEDEKETSLPPGEGEE